MHVKSFEKQNQSGAMCVCCLCTSDEHDADREDLLGVCVGRHVAEAHAGQAAEGEVEWGHVDAAYGRAAAGPVHTRHGVVRRFQALAQLVEPACFWMEGQMDG